MGQGRRQFTDEFKREAVAVPASSGRPLLQIASELGISPSIVCNWRNRSRGEGGDFRRLAFEPHPIISQGIEADQVAS